MCPLYSRLVWYRCHLYHSLVTIMLVGRSALYCRIYKTLNYKKMMSYYRVYSGNSILIRNRVLSAAAKDKYMRTVLGPQLCGTAAISMQTRYITNRQLLHWQHQAPCLPVELEHAKDFDV